MWFKDYNHYRKASDLASESLEMQIAYLRLRARAKIDNTQDHQEAMAALNKLCFNVINPAVICQIQLFKMMQSKSETASAGVIQMWRAFCQAEMKVGDWKRIESLLMLKFVTNDSVLKELHKDIHRNMASLDILKEAII